MQLFFDHQIFSEQLYGGISRYFCELITGINKSSEHNAHLSLLWSNNIHLKEYNINSLPYPFPTKKRFLQKSNQLYNVIDCKLGNYDIYHTTYFNGFLNNVTHSKPIVTTFYDMIYEKLSYQFAELAVDKLVVKQKKEIADKASHLIAISESTKRDMIELMNISPERISVIHLGSSFVSDSHKFIIAEQSDEKPYILYVGNRSIYKNFNNFLKASIKSLKRYKMSLVCAGGGEFNAHEIELIRSLSITDSVLQVAVNDKILPELYKNATAFIFPSLYEGFGIPILEAFSCDCPCAISNISSFPEVAGNAALYFDPSDQDSMENAIDRIITDNALRKELIALGQQRLSLFSWQNTVKQTLDLYIKLV